MESQRPQLLTLIEARQEAGRRYVRLALAAAMTKFTTRTVSDAQYAEVEAAKGEWEAATQASTRPGGD